VVQAELLVHVADLSHPQADEQIVAVNNVLEEIGAAGKPTLMVFNKLDRFTNGELPRHLVDQFPNAVGISAKTGQGMDALLAELGSLLRPVREFVELRIPQTAPSVVARLHEVAQVVERHYNGRMARFKARIPPHFRREFEAYIVADAAADGNGKV
jgi:GTPase